jgi:hypothetical protein
LDLDVMSLPGGLPIRYFIFRFLIGLIFAAGFLLIFVPLADHRLMITLPLTIFAIVSTLLYPYAHVVYDRMNFSGGNGELDDSSMDLTSFIFFIIFLYVGARIVTWALAIPAMPFALSSLRERPMGETRRGPR